MILNRLISQYVNGRLIRQFGTAKLIRQGNGRHELVGGTRDDRAAALEWVSLFAHDIVFTHLYRAAGGRGRSCRVATQLQPAI